MIEVNHISWSGLPDFHLLLLLESLLGLLLLLIYEEHIIDLLPNLHILTFLLQSSQKPKV